jgi:hypothetical protein
MAAPSQGYAFSLVVHCNSYPPGPLLKAAQIRVAMKSQTAGGRFFSGDGDDAGGWQ